MSVSPSVLKCSTSVGLSCRVGNGPSGLNTSFGAFLLMEGILWTTDSLDKEFFHPPGEFHYSPFNEKFYPVMIC